MKIAHFSIAGLMVLVLIVAFNFGVARMLFGQPMPLIELITLGGLPMANILALGLYACLNPRRRTRAARRALVGFEVGGTLAWLGFFAAALLATGPVHDWPLDIMNTTGLEPGPIKALLVASLYLAPQVAFGLLGGWLNAAVIRRAGGPISGRSGSLG